MSNLEIGKSPFKKYAIHKSNLWLCTSLNLETLEIYLHPPKICNFCLMHKFKQKDLVLALLFLLLCVSSTHPNIIT